MARKSETRPCAGCGKALRAKRTFSREPVQYMPNDCDACRAAANRRGDTANFGAARASMTHEYARIMGVHPTGVGQDDVDDFDAVRNRVARTGDLIPSRRWAFGEDGEAC